MARVGKQLSHYKALTAKILPKFWVLLGGGVYLTCRSYFWTPAAPRFWLWMECLQVANLHGTPSPIFVPLSISSILLQYLVAIEHVIWPGLCSDEKCLQRVSIKKVRWKAGAGSAVRLHAASWYAPSALNVQHWNAFLVYLVFKYVVLVDLWTNRRLYCAVMNSCQPLANSSRDPLMHCLRCYLQERGALLTSRTHEPPSIIVTFVKA